MQEQSAHAPVMRKASIQKYTDNQLVEMLANGNYEAFDELYMRYAPKVFLFASGLLKNENDAEDLTHDIFVKIWEHRVVIANVRSFQDYLFRMVKNASFDLISHKKVSEAYACNEKLDASGIFENDVLEGISSKDLLLLINIALEKMPEHRRTIFKMSRIDGMSYKEIAAALGIKEKAVEYNISVVIRELRAMMT